MLTPNDLHDYQKRIANHILTHKQSFVIAEMGLGKTISTLSALSRIVGKALIIAPLRVAHSSWPDEIAKWSHTKDMSYEIFHGTNRGSMFTSRAKIHITNYESLPKIMASAEGLKKLPWDSLVLDESSKCKAHNTKRFKMLKKLRSGFDRIVLLTGTPCSQSLWDLWAQTFILDGGDRFGKFFGKFREKYFYLPNPYQKYNWKPKRETPKQMRTELKDITISLKTKDYLKLPKISYNRIPVELDKKSLDIYKELEEEFYFAFDDNTVTVSNAAILSSKLRQVLQGGLYGEEKTNYINKAKVDVLKDICEESDTPILCAYQFKFEEQLVKKNIKHAVFLSRNIAQSKEEIKAWNQGKIKLLCVHPASAGHGLNLQAGGHTIVWLALTWSLEHYLQTNARLYRQGQKQPVMVHHIVCNGTVDDRVAGALSTKNATQETLINSLKRTP